MLRQKWLCSLSITALMLPLVFAFRVKNFFDSPVFANPPANERIQSVNKRFTNTKINTKNTQRQYRTALVIGNANYNEVGRLNNPINDASDIANNLRQLGFEVTHNNPPSPVTASPTTQTKLPPTNSTRTVYFTQPPRLLLARTYYNDIRIPSVNYYFTIQIPENAGEGLQRVVINQREGVDYVRFDLKNSFVFEGTPDREGKKIELKDISNDQTNQTVSIAFNQPVSPGKTITVALEAIQNPAVEGVYLFGVTAFPAGEKAHGQFLGFGRLHFYNRRG